MTTDLLVMPHSTKARFALHASRFPKEAWVSLTEEDVFATSDPRGERETWMINCSKKLPVPVQR